MLGGSGWDGIRYCYRCCRLGVRRLKGVQMLNLAGDLLVGVVSEAIPGKFFGARSFALT
jgi:hypothetical protein